MAFLGKLLGRDSLHDLRDALVNLEFLADAEARISDFYRLCADAMPEEKDLWNSLADQELQHAHSAGKMIELINKEPEVYKPGISFSTVSIRLFAVEMQRLLEQMRQGRIPTDKLFEIALEIEDSAVELSYSKIVKTKDRTYQSLAHQVDTESAEHKFSISSRVAAASTR